SNPMISSPQLTNDDIKGVAVDGGTVPTNGHLAGTSVWNSPDIVYWLTGNLSVPAGAKLTIGAGQKVKLANLVALFVFGTLQVNGTAVAPVVFTSRLDDTVGGDTNNDAGASAPAAGDWARIEIDAGASATLNNVELRYGGGSSSGEL